MQNLGLFDALVTASISNISETDGTITISFYRKYKNSTEEFTLVKTGTENTCTISDTYDFEQIVRVEVADSFGNISVQELEVYTGIIKDGPIVGM